jgi:fructose-1,6-bisphosphatase/inositol monophosphatase family enzyme
MVEYFLPVLVTAGDYALAIQPRVIGQADKEGPNPWAQALTDADEVIQTYVEVAALARFPWAGFFGEEQQGSRNRRYFPAEAATRIWLDPVNGTYLYKNQRPGWDIILSISRNEQLLAAISYMPARGRFYLALRGQGAFTGDRDSRSLAQMQALVTRAGSGAVLGYQAPELLAKLRQDFDCFDIVADDDPARGYDNLNDLFTGRLDAFVCRRGDLLDWGAIAFIVENAGGCVSAPDGNRLDIFEDFGLRTADMLVAASPTVHARIRALL